MIVHPADDLFDYIVDAVTDVALATEREREYVQNEVAALLDRVLGTFSTAGLRVSAPNRRLVQAARKRRIQYEHEVSECCYCKRLVPLMRYHLHTGECGADREH